MPKFILFEGSYHEIFNQFGFEAIIDHPYSPDEMEVLKRDLHRICYYSEYVNVEEIKSRVSREFNAIPNNRYLQGDLSAGLPATMMAQVHATAEHPPTFWVISTCYIDDNNQLCSFSMFLRPSNTVSNEFEYALAIYRNVTQPQENRRIIYISNSKLLPEFLIGKGAELSSNTDVFNQVEKALQCASLSKAIKPIFMTTGIATKKAFDKIKNSWVTNRNNYFNVYKRIRRIALASLIGIALLLFTRILPGTSFVTPLVFLSVVGLILSMLKYGYDYFKPSKTDKKNTAPTEGTPIDSPSPKKSHRPEVKISQSPISSNPMEPQNDDKMPKNTP